MTIQLSLPFVFFAMKIVLSTHHHHHHNYYHNHNYHHLSFIHSFIIHSFIHLQSKMKSLLPHSTHRSNPSQTFSLVHNWLSIPTLSLSLSLFPTFDYPPPSRKPPCVCEEREGVGCLGWFDLRSQPIKRWSQMDPSG